MRVLNAKGTTLKNIQQIQNEDQTAALNCNKKTTYIPF